MASFLAQATSNSKVQLAATAVVSGAVVAAAILGFQRLQQEERLSRLKKSIPDPDGNDNALQKVGPYLLQSSYPASISRT